MIQNISVEVLCIDRAKGYVPNACQVIHSWDLGSLYVYALCQMSPRCQGRSGPRTQYWLCTSGVLETQMRMVSLGDGVEGDQSVFKGTREEKYQEQAETNLLGNFTIKETKKWNSSLSRRGGERKSSILCRASSLRRRRELGVNAEWGGWPQTKLWAVYPSHGREERIMGRNVDSE